MATSPGRDSFTRAAAYAVIPHVDSHDSGALSNWQPIGILRGSRLSLIFGASGEPEWASGQRPPLWREQQPMETEMTPIMSTSLASWMRSSEKRMEIADILKALRSARDWTWPEDLALGPASQARCGDQSRAR